MSVAVEVKRLFNDVQRNHGSELRYCHKLSKLREQSSNAEFVGPFLECVLLVLKQSPTNIYAQQVISFAASFAVFVAQKDKRKNPESSSSQDTHPFLRHVLRKVLEKQSSSNHNVRYHVCYFIAVAFDVIGDEDILDENVCDYVQALMLERLMDPKSNIRIKAIDTLYRLQNPQNPRCAVISAFLVSCRDPHSEVRKLIAEKIAPCKYTVSTIVGSLSDICEKIRSVAFRKFSAIPPTWLKISQRQEVLRKGFDEDGKAARKAFTEMLLPKWISHYENNFLAFLKAVKLDADDKDVESTNDLSCRIMGEIFKTYQIGEIIAFLPIDKRKLIPTESLTSEIVLYWSLIHRQILINRSDELLEAIVPDLTPFCDYIEGNMDVFYRDPRIQDWKKLENDFITRTLFKMALAFDFSDEVGRNRLHELVTNSLINLPLSGSVIIVLIDVLAKLNSDVNGLIAEISELVNNISDSKNVPTLEYRTRCNEELMHIKEKLNTLSEELDLAIKEKRITRAFELEEEMTVIKNLQVKLKNDPYTCEPEREVLLDEKCVDIIIGLLKHRAVRGQSPVLSQIEERYIKGDKCEQSKTLLYKKIFECCVLFAINNEDCARDYVDLVSVPIYYYLEREHDDEDILLLSIYGVTDLLRKYGPRIFPDEPSHTDNFSSNEREHPYVKYLIEKMIDMLDEKRLKLQEGATRAISKIIYYGIAVTSTTFARILLKWFNPANTQIRNQLGQQMFGVGFCNYCEHFEESKTVVFDAIVPVLITLSRTYINDINTDNLIKFLTAITQFRQTEEMHLHDKLNYRLCSKILENVNAVSVELFVRMLISLEVPEKQTVLDDLKSNIQAILKIMSNSAVRRKLTKHLESLKRVKYVDETVCAGEERRKLLPSHRSDSETDVTGNYTIHDSDDSIGTPTSLKRNYSVGINDGIDSMMEAVDNASMLLHKKMKLVDHNINEIVEHEGDLQHKERTNLDETESSSPKKAKLDDLIDSSGDEM